MTTERRKPQVGDVWKWKTPTGAWREMLIERFQDGPGQRRRACGHHPEGTKRIQVPAAVLEKGLQEATFVRAIEGYVHHPVRS